jgi:hypothetical protein
MKALGALLILVAVGYVSYQYAYPPIMDMLGIEKAKPVVVDIPQPVIVNVEPPPPPKKKEPKPAPKPPEPAPQPTPAAMPPVATTMGASVPVADADGFIPPTFPPIEDVVKNWMEIPRTAFPRPVKVMKPVEFVTVINGNKIGSKVPAGGQAQVVGQEGLTLTVAPSPTSSAKAKIPIDDTDLKAVLNEAYERWKVSMTEWKRRQHLFAKESAGRAKEAKASGSTAVVSNDAPKKNSEGSYDMLLASMKAGQVTEITPSNIKKWGDVQVEKIDGKDYFTVIVDYTTKTMFGDFDTQAQARIINGKVEKWIYTGSGEVVP